MNPFIICYQISFFASLSFLLVGLFIFHNKISIFYHLLFTTIAVSSLGFLQTACAQNIQMAVSANQITYFGASFTPILMLLCFADLCKYKMNKILFCTWVFLSISIFICTSTVQSSHFYYKSFYIIEKYGITIFKKTYGFLHNFYYVYIISTNLFGFYITARATKRQNEVSFITSGLLLLSMFLSLLGFGIQKMLGLSVTIVPMTNLLSELFIFLLLVRIRLYDVRKISSDFIEESKFCGFILFDKNGKYLGSDPIAKIWFPEINQLKLDQQIPRSDSPFLNKIHTWINDGFNSNEYFETNDQIIQASLYQLKKKTVKAITVVNLLDNTQQQKYTHLVENYNMDLEAKVEQKTERLCQIQNDILISMANIIESRDNNTGGHVARTSDVVKIFISHLKKNGNHPELTEEFSECVIKAAPLHDFGKIAIPDMILNKPGKFTDEEYNVMKMHSAKGAVIVNKILNNADDPFFKLIAVNVAHYHHEKWNGQGYPEQLSENSIPFEARIMALADVFDALVSKRVYKDSFSYDEAFEIMEKSMGSHFDPELCREFIECRPQLEQLYNSY